MADKVLTHEEITRMGGNETLRRYGKEHFSKIAKKGGEALKKRITKEDPDYYKKLSQLGKEARRKKKEETLKSAST